MARIMKDGDPVDLYRDIVIHEVVLKKLRGKVSKMIAPSVLNRLTSEEIFNNEVGPCLLYTLEYEVLSKKEEKHITKYVKVPETWWDAVKIRFMPSWLNKYFEVCWREIPMNTVINKYKICPHLNIVAEKDHVRFFMQEDLNG